MSKDDKPILAKKADYVRASRPVAPTPRSIHAAGATKSVLQAAKRAALPYPALMLEPRDAKVVWGQSLAEVTEELPEGGVLVVLENKERQRGLIHLHQNLLDALIEVQTTGSVDTVTGPNRPATAIDGALSQEYINAFASSLCNELDKNCANNLVAELSFGTIVDDRKHLPLLVPERGFHLFTAAADLGETGRVGTFLIALPNPAGVEEEDALPPDQDWTDAWHSTLGRAEVPFQAVLFRRRLELKKLLALKPGDVIPFEAEDLSNASLEDSINRCVMRGRLGQVGGKRAIRLSIAAKQEHEPPPEVKPGFADSAHLASTEPTPALANAPAADQPASQTLEPLAAAAAPVPQAPDGDLPPLPETGGDAPPSALGTAGELPPPGESGGLPPLGEGGGLPPLGAGGDLPPLGELPPMGELPPLAGGS